MKEIVSLSKQRGFVFQSSEIYGGLKSAYDYGPLGVELKRNVKEAWWRDMVLTRSDIVGIDCAILMHPRVWEASGHVAGFSDPLVDCRNCKERFRADKAPRAENGTEVEYLEGGKRGGKKLKAKVERGYVCPQCGHREEIFKHGGGRRTAERLKVPFLGEIPLDPKVAIGGDAGQPIVVAEPDSAVTASYISIAEEIAKQLGAWVSS